VHVVVVNTGVGTIQLQASNSVGSSTVRVGKCVDFIPVEAAQLFRHSLQPPASVMSRWKSSAESASMAR
jgi:hypothetical protein